MPIVFAQPEPVASAAVGRVADPYALAKLLQQGTGTIADIGMNAARIAGQKAIAQFEGDTRAAIAQAQVLAEQADNRTRLNYQDKWQGQDYQLGLAGLAARLEQEAMQNQAAAQRQKRGAELQAWLNEQDLTQRDRIQYQKDMTAISAINADPNLTQEEKYAAIASIKSNVDVFKLREQSERARQQKFQTDTFIEQARTAAKVANSTFKDQTEAFKAAGIFQLPGVPGLFQHVVGKGIQPVEIPESKSSPEVKPPPFAERMGLARARAEAESFNQFPIVKDEDSGLDTNEADRKMFQSRRAWEILEDQDRLPAGGFGGGMGRNGSTPTAPAATVQPVQPVQPPPSARTVTPPKPAPQPVKEWEDLLADVPNPRKAEAAPIARKLFDLQEQAKQRPLTATEVKEAAALGDKFQSIAGPVIQKTGQEWDHARQLVIDQMYRNALSELAAKDAAALSDAELEQIRQEIIRRVDAEIRSGNYERGRQDWSLDVPISRRRPPGDAAVPGVYDAARDFLPYQRPH
jgi:hypothetical protein